MNLFSKFTLLIGFIFISSCVSHRFLEKSHKIAAADELLKKNAEIKERYQFTFRGHEFVGFPNVYSPLIFPGASKQSDLPIAPGESFLEIGSGTGVFAVSAAMNGAQRVVATDINPDAVANTLENARLHNVQDRMSVYLGDMFKPLSPEDQFDVIFFNIPFCHRNVRDKSLTMLGKSLFDPNHDILYRYLKESIPHLKPNGRLLLGYSTTHGDVPLMQAWAKELLWDVKLLNKDGDEKTDFITVELYELSRK